MPCDGRQVLIIGAGGHGQVVADILLAGLEKQSSDLRPIGFLDDNPDMQGRVFLGLPVLGFISSLATHRSERRACEQGPTLQRRTQGPTLQRRAQGPTLQRRTQGPTLHGFPDRLLIACAVVVAVGNNSIRQKISQVLQAQGEQFAACVHPSTILGTGVEIDAGAMICAGVVVNVGAHIGRGVILNTGCTVDHHNHIDDYVHIAPGAHLGGDVKVGEGTLVGIGATVMPQRQIGCWSIVGAGAVVTKDVPDYTAVVGNPARVIKNHVTLERNGE